MSVLVGTCSWTDKTLIACGRFYPKGCSSAEARLRNYASRFPLVEVDSSYYAMPSRSNSELWVECTPRFRDAITPLDVAGKLKLVRFQFPPSLTRTSHGHDHVVIASR